MRYAYRLRWAGLLVVLLMVLTVSGAAAQGITGDKVVFGGNFTLPAGQTLNGKLTVMGGNAVLEPDSSVNGDVTILGGTLSAAGYIRGDVAVFGGSVDLQRSAVVEGNINTWGGSVQRAPGAVVRGTTQQGFSGNGPRSFFGPRLGPPLPDVPNPRTGPLGFLIGAILHFLGAVGLALVMAVIGVVVILVAPNATARVASVFAQQPAVNFAVGLLTFVLAMLLGIPLLICCGLGLLVWLLTIVALLFGWIAGGLWLGQRLLSLLKVKTSSSLVEAALGIFLITWVTWVSPRCIGWLFGLIVGSIGLGAVLLARFGTQPLAGSGSRPTPVAPAGLLTTSAAYEVGQGPAVGSVSGGSDVPPASAAATIDFDAGAPGTPEATAEVTAPAQASLQSAVATGARAVSLDDLSAIEGITPEIADRLRATGNTTLIAVATSEPETLAVAAGVPPAQVRAEDWIGQARRLLG
jgi:predicted flap endonuclease-1-like 5' DNA nuclease